MMGMEGEVRAFIMMVPTLIIFGITYMVPIKKRSNYIWRFLAALGIIFAVVAVGVKYLAFTESVTIIAYIAMYVFLSAMVWMTCQVTVTEAVYCAACAYLTQHLCYSAMTALWELTAPDGNNIQDFNFQGYYTSTEWSYYLMILCICVPVYFFFVKKLIKDGRYCIDSKQSLALVVITLCSTILLSHISTVMYQGIEYGGRLFGICRIYAMLCCIVTLWAQYNKSRELAVQQEVMAERELRRQQMNQYENYQENVELINYKCHDLKQQVAALRSMDRQVSEEVLSKVEESVMIYDAYVNTGNEVLDTILTEKNLWCEKNHITMACIADGKCFGFMDTVDIFAIFGNALTNAIESVSKIEDPDKRMISVMTYERMDVVFIQVENYYESEIIRNGELPESTKSQDGNHGYGLKSIRYSVRKYGGCMTIDTEEHIFKLQISIPLY